MSEFIGYTIGLECWVNDAIKMVKCEYSRTDNGVMIHAVSGNNLGRIGGGYCKNISSEEFEARPVTAYDDTVEAIWALKKIGLSPKSIENDADSDS